MDPGSLDRTLPVVFQKSVRLWPRSRRVVGEVDSRRDCRFRSVSRARPGRLARSPTAGRGRVCGCIPLARLRFSRHGAGTAGFIRGVARVLHTSGFLSLLGGLQTSDPRFTWDSHVGVDLDLFAYRAARLNLTADYEAVLGSERRAFEINHENYRIEASGAYVVHSIEVAGVFHHSSRHLSDRANSAVIAWNIAVLRAGRQIAVGKAILNAQLEVGHVLQHTYVDYAWTSGLRLAIRRPLNQRAALFAAGAGGLIGVDPKKAGRTERLCGARLETGVRIRGQTADVEFFASYERRIDAYPIDRVRVRWSGIGFRFLSR